MSNDKELKGSAKGYKNLVAPKKGEVRNPLGISGPKELTLARKLSKEFVEVKLTEMLQKNMDEIDGILADKSRQTIDHWICMIISKGIKEGDYRRLDFILDRLIGKVKDVKEITVPAPTIIQRRSGEQVELGSKMVDTNTIDME